MIDNSAAYMYLGEAIEASFRLRKLVGAAHIQSPKEEHHRRQATR